MTPNATRLMTDMQEKAMIDGIAAYVFAEFTKAIGARAAITRRMMHAIYANNLTYAPEACPRTEVDIYQGLIHSKANTVESWLKSVMLSAVNQLWDVQATAVPELPEAMNKAVYSMLLQAVQQAGGQVAESDMKGLEQALHELAQKHVKAVADDKVAKMKTYIADMMDDAEFPVVLAQFLVNVAHTTHGVLVGPEFGLKSVLIHDESADNGVRTAMRMVPQFRSADPLTVYWTADCTTPRDGTAIIEDSLVKVNTLLDAVENKIPGYIADTINEITSHSWQYNASLTPVDQHLTQVRKDEGLGMLVEGTKRILHYRGLVPGRLLKPYMESRPNFKEARMYECEVQVVDGRTVFLLTDVNQTLNRCYYITSMYNKGPTMVGNGLPDVLRTTERTCNAALRAMVKNMPFAAAPIAEADVTRFVDPEDINNFKLVPGKTYKVESDPLGGGQRAINAMEIPSNADQFLAVYNGFVGEADRVCGIPSYVTGTLDIASMARTASGLSILMRAATVVLQNVVANIDERVFTPMIRACYNWLMLNHPDRSIKADAAVLARGASGVLNRELGQARLQELLQLIAPFAQAQLLPPQVVLGLLREIISNTGYDADSLIPNDATAKAIQFSNALAQANSVPDAAASGMMIPPSAGANTPVGTPAIK